MKATFKFDTSVVENALLNLKGKVASNGIDVMTYTMGRAKEYGKQNAPWTDRTGNARRSIDTDVRVIDQSVYGTFYIGVEYGKWLELCHQGRYRIVQPTMDAHRSVLMNAARGLL